MDKDKTIEKALAYFDEGYSCAQSVLLAFSDRFHLDEKNSTRIAFTFGGGMGRLREKCGALTGSFMVLGLAYGNDDPKDMETRLEAYEKVRKLNHSFEEIFGTTNCGELLEKYATEADVAQRKHHEIICRRVIAAAAEKLFQMLEKEQTVK